MRYILRTIFISAFLLIMASAAQATDYTYCRDGVGYTDQSYATRQPNNDWICSLDTDVEGTRCPRAQERVCAHGTANGPHDVPSNGLAWFLAVSADSSKDVRCTCGCFAQGTLIDTSDGDKKIEDLLEEAKIFPVNVLVRASIERWWEFSDSIPMRARNFTKGPEEKKMIVLTLSNGATLSITDNHPVLLVKGLEQKMVRADEVRRGDVLLDRDGEDVFVESIERNSTARDVINFSSIDNNPLAHIVVANGIQVGDNLWQKYLDVIKSRTEQRLSPDETILENLLRYFE